DSAEYWSIDSSFERPAYDKTALEIHLSLCICNNVWYGSRRCRNGTEGTVPKKVDDIINAALNVRHFCLK
nr:hypothetical protein [Ruminococcus sp.]